MGQFNAIADHITAGVKQREIDVGATITWASQTFPCSGGALFGGKSITAGGLRTVAQLTIVVRLEHFAGGSAPAEKQLISYQATPASAPVTLRIDSATTALGALLVLECNDPNTGA